MNYRIRKTCLLLLACIACSCALNAQTTTTKAWEITYRPVMEMQKSNATTDSDSSDFIIKAFTEELAAYLKKDSAPALHCFLADTRLRIETNDMSHTIELGNKKDSTSFILNVGDSSVTKTTLLRPNLAYVGDSMIVLDDSSYRITLTEDTASFAGIVCKKARIEILPLADKDSDIFVWYAPNLPQMYWDKYNYLAHIPGCALAILSQSRGTQLGIKAVTAREVTVPNALFELPKGYKISEY
ncbi:hypothetical protein KTO58_21600 [Chitinophaga pendula]|uniref:hypothetical protein n=1 Tax=Chitinophaga TaxID=79328 RepID=UPI000BAF2557|nr:MULTISPECIES: hypothetical protein [Chitinophaga]ASZ10778.1 hypothetical protein CK934_07200 [Chitinophaga sp. MD30]UCJ06245.1 hypothetical protein KTO58_21600 [Chitinophaga pendula]